jgi:hypothetical protein
MDSHEAAHAEFRSLSDALKCRRGVEFEEDEHPAALVDRATGPSVQVWGWWTATAPRLACLLWSSERGWSATVVEPAEVGAPGYELAHWSHRIQLLDLALANAVGPHATLGLLELHVALDATLGLSPFGSVPVDSLTWGIARLRTGGPGLDGQAVASATLPPTDGEESRIHTSWVRAVPMS